MKELLSIESEGLVNFSKEFAFLTTGADSPVRAHSLISTLP